MSCYAPAWFKRDVKRFPRAVTAEGKPLEIASCCSNNVLQADLKAFSALMQHIAEKDPQREVVIMMHSPLTSMIQALSRGLRNMLCH